MCRASLEATDHVDDGGDARLALDVRSSVPDVSLCYMSLNLSAIVPKTKKKN